MFVLGHQCRCKAKLFWNS